MKALIRALVPKRLRPAFRRPYNYVRHKLFLTKLFGHYASMIPPLKLMYDGPVGFEEFKTNGEEFFRYYTKLCDLKPYERMLDVGSGITRGYPRFKFQLIDVCNQLFNLRGRNCA